jgi:hypothetical protein
MLIIILLLFLIYTSFKKPKNKSNYPLDYQDHSTLVEKHLMMADTVKQNIHFNEWFEDNKKM